jgi:hypothetical protein
MPDTPFKAALWSAVSSAAQAAAEKISLIDQIDKERAVCKARGWRIVQELVVAGHSREYASLDTGMREIPELARLIEMGRDGVINLLVCYDSNRFRGLQSTVIKTLASYGVQTFSLNQPLEPADPSTFRYYHSDTQTIMTHVGSLISDVEISALRRRYDVGMPKRVDVLGLHLNNHLPYGYRKPAGHELDHRAVAEQVPAECAVLLEIRRRYLAGASSRAIADWLIAEKIPPAVEAWSGTRVLEVLSNPYYAGLVARNQRISRRDLVTGKRHVTHLPVSEWKVSPGRHPGLWTADDWRHLIEVRTRRGDRQRGQIKHTRAFSLLMVCQECGGTLVSSKPLRDGTRVYRCFSGASKIKHGRVSETGIISSLRVALENRLTGPLPDVEPYPAEEIDGAAVVKALAENDAARARYQRLYARGGISDSDLDHRLEELAAERRVLDRTQAEAGETVARAKRRANWARDAAALLADFDGLWCKPPEEANARISELVELILVEGREIKDVIWRD